MKYLKILGPILIILIWQIIAKLNIIDVFFFPEPLEVLKTFLNLLYENTLTSATYATVTRTVKAFVISLLLGVPIGLILGKIEKIYRSAELVIDFFRSMPATAIFPLFMIIFGIGDSSKIAVATFASILIIIFNTAYGVINNKKTRTLLAQTMGANKWQIFSWINFWESLPQTFIGLRNAISISLIIIVVTEMFIGTDVGLGRLIVDFQLIYNIKGMYASIVMTGIVGYLLNYVLLLFEKKLVHWK